MGQNQWSFASKIVFLDFRTKLGLPLRQHLHPIRLAGTARTCSGLQLSTLDPGPSTPYGALRSFGLLTLIGAPLANEAMTLGELVRSAAEINSAKPAPANSEPQT